MVLGGQPLRGGNEGSAAGLKGDRGEGRDRAVPKHFRKEGRRKPAGGRKALGRDDHFLRKVLATGREGANGQVSSPACPSKALGGADSNGESAVAAETPGMGFPLCPTLPVETDSVRMNPSPRVRAPFRPYLPTFRMDSLGRALEPSPFTRTFGMKPTSSPTPNPSEWLPQGSRDVSVGSGRGGGFRPARFPPLPTLPCETDSVRMNPIPRADAAPAAAKIKSRKC